MELTDRQFEGFIRLILGYIDRAIDKSPDIEELTELRDILRSML